VEGERRVGSGINAISCVGRGISTHASRDLVENILVRVPGVGSLAQGIGAVSRNRGRTSRIVFQSVRIVGWPEIKERGHVDLVIEDANAATYDQFFASGGLIGKTNARSEVILVGWENGTDSVALNLNASSRRHEDGEILAVVVQWSEVIPAKSPVQVQPRCNLPRVLTEKVDAIDHNFALGIADGNSRAMDEAGQKISEGGGRVSEVVPGPLRTIECKLPQGMAEVELVNVSLAHFAAETELMLADIVGKNVGEHTCDVIAPFGRCNADLLESADRDIWCAQNR